MKVLFFFVLICHTVVHAKERTIASGFQFPNGLEGDFNPRIIGGTTVAPNSYPFQAAVQATYSGSRGFCGGSLITSEWVLTAAHCIDENPTRIDVILGAHNLSNPSEPTRQQYRCTTYVIHPEWNATILQNDIALIKLPQNATLNSFVSTVRFATGNDLFARQTGTTLGWGRTETGNASSTLMGVDTVIMSNSDCRAVRSYYQIIISTHLCVSGTGPRGSCSGDSGGPLLVNGVQVGIVSFGPENCTLSLPSVYTRVSKFSKWIQRTISGATKSSTVCYTVLFVILARFLL